MSQVTYNRPTVWLPPSHLAFDDEEQKSGGGSAVLGPMGNRINRVQLGVPQTIDILAVWDRAEHLQPEIVSARARFDFFCVRLACSFIPDRGCQFVHARLSVKLVDKTGGAADAPVAADLFPRDVSTKCSFSRSFSISGGLKLSFAEVSGKLSEQKEVIHYEPSVIAAGLLTDEPNWTLEATTEHALAGIRELFLVVKKSRASDVVAQFSVGAEVRSAMGLRRCSNPHLLEAAFPLMP